MSDKKRNSPASRRARKKGVFVEHIDKRKLWTDYQGICGLCLQPVKFARTTIDHIIPLSQGGMHEYANVQPAHSRWTWLSQPARRSAGRVGARGTATRRAERVPPCNLRSARYNLRTGYNLPVWDLESLATTAPLAISLCK
jgi:hypothetical protein